MQQRISALRFRGLAGGFCLAALVACSSSTQQGTAPTLTTQPQSLVVAAPATATFTVVAAGTPTPTYQWYQGSTAITPGGTSASYTTPAASAAMDGATFSVTVSNGIGTPVTSTVATLTVAAEPAVVFPGSQPMSLVPIPAGTFTMGSPASDLDYEADEGPQHPVTLSQISYMGTDLVTQEQWQMVMGSNPSYFKMGTASNPVEEVSWDDIATSTASPAYTCFLDRLNAQMATLCPLCPPGYAFRLPTEAEWEYACRADTTTRFYWGDLPDSDITIQQYAWYAQNTGMTSHVGLKLANAWGLYDMGGNVWEWCQDWYGATYYTATAQTDPVGPASGTTSVIRGGSYQDNSGSCRPAKRNAYSPAGHTPNIGFRLVLAPARPI